MDHHYQILEVKPNDSDEVIKKAYVKKVKQYHPDKHPKEHRKIIEKKFKEINKAYQAIIQDRNNDDDFDFDFDFSDEELLKTLIPFFFEEIKPTIIYPYGYNPVARYNTSLKYIGRYKRNSNQNKISINYIKDIIVRNENITINIEYNIESIIEKKLKIINIIYNQLVYKFAFQLNNQNLTIEHLNYHQKNNMCIEKLNISRKLLTDVFKLPVLFDIIINIYCK